MNNIINLREYWTLSTKVQNFYFKNDMGDDYNEAEDEDGWDCDEDGHLPIHNDVFTECGFCEMNLVRKRINDKAVYVSPVELEKLEQWNAMSTQHGQDDRLTINSNLSSTGESEEA